MYGITNTEFSNIWKNLVSRAMSNTDVVPKIHDYELSKDDKDNYPPYCRIYNHVHKHKLVECYMVMCYDTIRHKVGFLSSLTEISIFNNVDEAYEDILNIYKHKDYKYTKFFIAHVMCAIEDINLKEISNRYSGIKQLPVIQMIENYYCNFDNKIKNYQSELDDSYYKNKCFSDDYFYDAILETGYEWRNRPTIVIL